MIALKTIDLSWYQNLDYYYNLRLEELIVLIFLSISISTILHYLYKTDFKTSNNNQIEITQVKKYSIATKIVVMFFALILVCMPVFKLLKTGYFL